MRRNSIASTTNFRIENFFFIILFYLCFSPRVTKRYRKFGRKNVRKNSYFLCRRRLPIGVVSLTKQISVLSFSLWPGVNKRILLN